MHAEHENKNENYLTSDLALASYLAIYFSLLSVDKSNPSRATFIFKGDPDIQLKVSAYWSKSALVDPTTYFSSLKHIKARLYD